MFREKDKDDLRNEIFSLKVQLNNVKNENCLLKVKVRKLQEEIVKKNKHIEVLLNPKKSSAFHKVMSENGATIVMNALDRNLKLQKLLDERNSQIKKLESELETTRLYTNKKRPVSVKSNNGVEMDKMKINMPVKNLTIKESKGEKSNSLTASLEGHCAYNANNEKNIQDYCPRNSGSPESDLDRNELFCETPHKEIQQLHKYVIDVLSEVDTLKETIAQMQGERNKKPENHLETTQNELQIKKHRRIKNVKSIPRNNKECNNKKVAVIKSPRKTRVKKNTKKGRNDDVFEMLPNCMDTIETQIQRESSCIDTESDSDGIS